MNTINVIAPYKHLGMWVFDDPRVGLNQEPFVSGADTMIDRVVAETATSFVGYRAPGSTDRLNVTPFTIAPALEFQI
jgi:hypothetical protein